MSKNKGLRIIFQCNAPWCATGDGTQGKYLLPAWKDMPEIDDVLIFSFYGLQGGRIHYRLGKHTFEVWPLTQNDWGNETIGNYAIEYEADLVITLLDIWPLDPNYGNGFMWAPYAPIDVMPVPKAFTDRLRNAYLPITYAKHASNALDEIGVENVYAPHGVDTKQYRPVPQNRKKYREMLQFNPASRDCFIFGMVSANKGFPPRKAFPEVFEAFSKIREQRDDVWLYIHTIFDESMGGPNLQEMARVFGIQDRVMAANKHLMMSGCYDDGDMMRIYNSIDCLLSPSYSEGFGLPQIEAQACGIPVISTDAFAMTELNGAGWLVPWDHKLYMPVGASYVMPNVSKLAEAMEEAITQIRKPKMRKILGNEARNFALEYDWDVIIRKYWRPIIQRFSHELTPRMYVMK